tara:strand:+ start:896 stop:1090 length:195 start_codon:yes stop_codon:yes gene_type:complete
MDSNFEIDLLDGQAWIVKTIEGIEYSATLTTAEEYGLNATDTDELIPVPSDIIAKAYALEEEQA